MHGGFREGAGRKVGYAAKNAEEARKLLSERVAEEIGPICDMLISRAKQGDIRATHELLDRAWGRAPQAKEAPDADNQLIIQVVNYGEQKSEESSL